MLTPKIEKALNTQLNKELYSAYLYLSMAAWCESQNLAGMANWMRVQFEEEQFHAMKFFNYIAERGGKIDLMQIDTPEKNWDNPLAVFEATLAHEHIVTGYINELVYLARDERDNATEIFLSWYVNEQVEEEASVEAILGKLRIAKDSPEALLMIDQSLAARVFTPPAPTA